MRKGIVPIAFVIAGILMLFAGAAVASAEENAAGAVGNFLQNKWVAFGLIFAGVIWYASDEGYLRKAIG
jgi:hypothetical protein